MNKKVLSFIIILTLSLSMSSNSLAAPTSSQSNELKEARGQKQSIQLKVEKMNKEIDGVISEIDNNKQLMNKINKDVKNTEKKLNQVKNNVKIKQDLFGKRVRAMYISGGDSYLDIILASKNLSDFMSRIDTISKIMDFDKNVVTKLKAEKESIEKEKENLNCEKAKLASLKKNNEVILAKLNKDIQEEKNVLSKVTEKEKELASIEAAKTEENNKKAKEVKETKEIKKAKEVASNNDSNKGTLSRGESNSISSSKVMTMDATAYAGDGVTATGNATTRNHNGYSTIAVDPRVIPMYSKVYVEGYGYAIAHDTGGDIKGNRIDLYMHSEAECNRWGRRTVKVYIIN